jgi:catechol 2,3-dioxygenase-like lactoylglutathione lyase family enzyme
MTGLDTFELKAFVPARDYSLSKRFYVDLGFELRSDSGGVAYLRHSHCSFLLQDFYVKELAENLMMHLLVADVDAWWAHVRDLRIADTYGVRVEPPQERPWRMRELLLFDPSGVLWRIARNTP